MDSKKLGSEGQANERNGASGKTLLTERGPVRVALPRDRDGSFAPILIPKHARRFTEFDDRIVAMYARGMSVREIQAFLAERDGAEVWPDFPSRRCGRLPTDPGESRTQRSSRPGGGPGRTSRRSSSSRRTSGA